MSRPATIDLNDLVGQLSPEFTDLELYLADGVSNALVTAFGLNADNLQVVVILDEQAVARITDNQIVLSFSGRVYPPTVDANDQPLVDPDFKTPITEFFEKESIEFKFADTELMAFTCLVPAIDVNERAPEETKDEEEPAEDEDDDNEGGDEEEPEADEEPASKDGDQSNVDDFLDNLESDTAEEPEEKPEAPAPEPAKPEETGK